MNFVYVDKTGGSGIINIKISNDVVINPMDKNKYRKMVKGLERNGIKVIQAKGDDLRYLKTLGAEASYGNGYIMHIGEIPSASAMFEETIHSTQAKIYGEFNSNDEIELFAREIAANKKLLKNQKSYGFDDNDVNDIKRNLSIWEDRFENKVGVKYEESSYHREISNFNGNSIIGK